MAKKNQTESAQTETASNDSGTTTTRTRRPAPNMTLPPIDGTVESYRNHVQEWRGLQSEDGVNNSTMNRMGTQGPAAFGDRNAVSQASCTVAQSFAVLLGQAINGNAEAAANLEGFIAWATPLAAGAADAAAQQLKIRSQFGA